MTDNAAALEAPRKGCVDVFNEFMLEGVDLAGYYQIPKIHPPRDIPEEIVPFSETVSGRSKPDIKKWVHFYEDDVKIERFWRRPKYYAQKLRDFGGFISPDYSPYADFTPSQKIWNTHRNYASGAWLQQAMGYDVIANVRTSGWDSIPYALAGAPKDKPHRNRISWLPQETRGPLSLRGGSQDGHRHPGPVAHPRLRHGCLWGARLPEKPRDSRKGVPKRDGAETRWCA